MKNKFKIVYSGGGTLGPVTPLLAIHEMALKELGPAYEPHWIGTRQGLERELVSEAAIPYHPIVAGKLRRYISFWNITDLVKITFGSFQAAFLLLKLNPSLCISAGGFVSVPVHFAAWLLGIPTWIHQQDVQIGLANRIMRPLAKKITTVLEMQVRLFPPNKTTWLGNPVRKQVLSGSKSTGEKLFKTKPGLPVLLVTGGGTGSQRLNQLLVECLPHLKNVCQVIHLTGRDRPQELVTRAAEIFKDYYQIHQFLGKEMKDAYAIADLIVARGGFGTLTEIAALKKPVLVVPKPGHQNENVSFFEQQKAVYFLDEREIDSNFLGQLIKQLFMNPGDLKAKAAKLHDLLPPAESSAVISIIKELV